MWFKRSLSLLFGAGVLMASLAAGASECTGTSSPTLESLVACVRDRMPRRRSGVFVVPSPPEIAAWRGVVGAMMRGGCDIALPLNLSSIVQLRSVRDADDGRTYCVLLETADRNGDGVVDRGFGAFIVDAAAERELSHQVSHPIADMGTEMQAVTVFKRTRSRTLILAGAHRDAIPAGSGWQGALRTADVVRNPATMFHATHAELMAYYGVRPWWAIQWHGMAEETCRAVDVHLSHGMNSAPAPGDKILELRKNLLARRPTWRISVAGSRQCSLNATANVQGRLLNDSTPAWSSGFPAIPVTWRFVHIEQHPGFRDPGEWIDALMATWP
ncbi:hypothetical protein SOCEGT47_041580 [Sorangium cellulosum]|uniref:Secreted protein n=1 Tax=Sorangium cellulosum TaxID=56 RepID=A0A4P2Q2X0_SORCE|nr:hypothetical protein [Sorangium cellulosum]AUX23630.1 hypothetical protein SOCEGT47_041580 [Sorangium cellulosum]